jgi:WD40 repeat protein
VWGTGEGEASAADDDWVTVAEQRTQTRPAQANDNAPIVESAQPPETARPDPSKPGNLLMTLCGHTGRVEAVAYRPDGRHIASGASDNTIKVWDAGK